MSSSAPRKNATIATTQPGDGLHRALLVLWVATIGADRIDLSGGRMGALLTPFLALTPLVIVSELLRRHAWRRSVVFSRLTIAFVFLLFVLLSLVLTSVFVSVETTVSASRAALLAMLSIGSVAVAVSASDRDDLEGLLARGAAYGLLLFLIFDVAEFAVWFAKASSMVFHFGPVDVALEASPYAGFIPRLSGAVIDPNRGGYVIVCYAFFLMRGEATAWVRRWGLAFAVLLLAATISRSATATMLCMLLVRIIDRGHLRARPATLGFGAVFMAAVCVVALVWPAPVVRAATALVPLTERLSLSEGSAQNHVGLLGRGIEEATRSIPRALIGLGFGASYTVLQDFFPGNRYGNFHSLYVSTLAESGVFALVIMCILLIVPAVRRGPYRALVVGTIAFNIFYQSALEPAFWVILILAWTPARSAVLEWPVRLGGQGTTRVRPAAARPGFAGDHVRDADAVA